MMLSDIAVPYEEVLYASDASETRGAICSTEVGADVIQMLCKVCKTKGAYTRLQSEWSLLMKKVFKEDVCFEEEAVPTSVARPIAFSFDFIEVFAGASRVTAELSALGIVCGPPLDISISPEYDLKQTFVLEWLYHLLEAGHLRGLMLEPPCTTFSIMRRPPLRDAAHPFGFDPSEEKTRDGNILSQRGLQLMWKAGVHGAAALFEKPFTAKTKHLPSYQAVRNLPGAMEIRADSCQFGSPHQKSFSFLGINLELQLLQRRCQGKCKHVPVQGVHTKASAIYTHVLAQTLAQVFYKAIAKAKLQEADDFLDTYGLENQLVNELMVSSKWQVERSWKFKRPSHINLLEMKAVERLVEKRAKEGPSRFACIVDSNVTRCALGKGRSSSKALSSVIRRIACTAVAFAQYMVNPFCPTRLNCADDPTRDTPLRGPVRGCDWRSFSRRELWAMASIRTTKKWASNWVRLTFLLVGPVLTQFADRSVYRWSLLADSDRSTVDSASSKASLSNDFSSFDFDQTLGFPGEGPSISAQRPPSASSFVGFSRSLSLSRSMPGIHLTRSSSGLFSLCWCSSAVCSSSPGCFGCFSDFPRVRKRRSNGTSHCSRCCASNCKGYKA